MRSRTSTVSSNDACGLGPNARSALGFARSLANRVEAASRPPVASRLTRAAVGGSSVVTTIQED